MATQPNTQQHKSRPSPKFPPSVWGCSFASLSSQHSEFELYTKEVEILKQEMNDILIDSSKELIEKIKFINLLCRLGVSYHFQNEIEQQLNHIFNHLPKLLDDNDFDLNTTGSLFRVFRDYGYKIISDVFNKFKASDGGFKENLASDVKGLLSLYEATFLSVHGEHILDEAETFSRQHLEIVAEQASPRLANYIRNALLQPFNRNLERIEARRYIAFYEGEESKDEALLRFAKLDYNRLQIQYRQELASLSRWWKKWDVSKKLDYSRDRIVEAYIWSVGPNFEPQYSLSRMLGAKFIQIITLIDDTYDAYATIDELERFTSAIERWNTDAIDELPEYMKVLYEFTFNYYDEMEKDGYDTCYVKEKFKEMVLSYYVEAQWFNNRYTPAFAEYIRNGLVTIGSSAIPATAFIGMKNIVGTEELQWIETNPKLVQAVRLICRLKNDLATRQDEREKNDGPSSVDCYMNEYSVSREKAIEEIKKLRENAWKDMNEDCLKPTAVSRNLLKYYVNLARTIEFLYRQGDYYTNSSSMKNDITLLFLQQFPIYENELKLCV